MHAVQTRPPHALFQDAEMFLLLDGVSLICLWLLFRRSREPLVAALFVVTYWTPFFYVTTLFPQTSLAPGSPVGLPYNASSYAQWNPTARKLIPVVCGVAVPVQMLVDALWINLTVTGYLLLRKGVSEGAHDSRSISFHQSL